MERICRPLNQFELLSPKSFGVSYVERSMNPALAELQGLLIKAVNCIAVDTGQVSIGFRTVPSLCFCVRVAPSDLAKIIGRHGNTIRALRTVIQAAGQQKGMAVRICIAEEEAGLKQVTQPS